VEPGLGSARRPGWQVGGEGHRLAGELLELADQVAFLAVPAAGGLIEVGTQIAVTSVGVGQQVPHDRQDRVADRDKGALRAAAFGDAAVALAEEGAGAPGVTAISPRVAASHGLPLPVAAVLALPAEGLAWGANLATPPAAWPLGRRPCRPELGDELLGADPFDAGHRIQPGDLSRERRGLLVDPAGQLVDPLQHPPAEEPVMVVDVPSQGLLELAELGPHARRGQLGEYLGSRCPAIIAWSRWRPDTPKRSRATDDSVSWASSRSFSTRCCSRVRSRISVRRYRVRSPNRRIGAGGTKLGRHLPRSTTLASHPASSWSVWGGRGRS
jgi:hypothetical protein